MTSINLMALACAIITTAVGFAAYYKGRRDERKKFGVPINNVFDFYTKRRIK